MTSLLWINKDASNVHRKKHIAEVNAHVQKSSLKKRTPKSSLGKRKVILPARRGDTREISLPSPGTISSSSYSDSGRHEFELSVRESSHSVDHTSSQDGSPAAPAAAVIFSSYLEEDLERTIDNLVLDGDKSSYDFQISELTQQSQVSLPTSLDASNPLPGFLGDLPSHDRMLVHTHLTYLPQLYYGLSNRAPYCPIRNASVTNILKEPIGILWVLISLDMFLETARKSNARKAAIIHRKTRAYHLMAESLKNQSQSNDPTLLLAPAAAAIAEMYCGDPDKAVTHLNGIDAFITERGGLEFVEQMEITTSMPVFAVSAYRTLLQDNLTNVECFERARAQFMGTLRTFLAYNTELRHLQALESHSGSHASPRDEGFDGNFDLADVFDELQETRIRAFVNHPILRKFIVADFNCTKPGEKVDHFIVLYNLNRALADHGFNLKQIIRFIEEFMDDVEMSGSTKGANSSLKISGVLRLLTHRQAKMYPFDGSAGVARAWGALDALEIMKLLTIRRRKLVCQTLHALLIGSHDNLLTSAELDAIDSALVAEWHSRHAHLSIPR